MSPTLTSKEAANNAALFQEHRDAVAKKNSLYIGIYRGRSFVVITEETSWFKRIKYFVLWLFGLISYGQEGVASLAEQSKKQWRPASELCTLETTQDLLAQAQFEIAAHGVEIDILRQGNRDWEEITAKKQEALVRYEKLHKEIQECEEEKEGKFLQEKIRANALELENERLKQELNRCKREKEIILPKQS